MYSRISLSPILRRSVACMWRQKAQPLICEARSLTSSWMVFSMLLSAKLASRSIIALMLAGAWLK